MPAVRSIEKLADGLRIVRSTGEVILLSAAAIPGNVKSRPVAEVEAWVNEWLLSRSYNAICRIRSLDPLDIDVLISNSPMTGWPP